MDAESREQPTAYESSQNTDDHISDDAKTRPLYDLTGQPARDETYEQDNQQAFARHVHFATSIVGSNGIHQSNEVLRQRVMLAGQFEPHAGADFFANGGTTGAADPNNFVDIRVRHGVLQFVKSAKPFRLAAGGDQSNFANDRFIAVQTLCVEPGPNLLRTTSRNR